MSKTGKNLKVKGEITLIDIIVVLAIVLVIAAIVVPPILKVVNEQTVTVTVTDKVVKRAGSKSTEKYLVFVEPEGNQETVFEITDSLLKWRFDSSDLYGRIEIGKRYRFEIAGLRMPFFSKYQNIYEAIELEE